MTEVESKNANFTKYKYRRMYRDAHTRYVNETTEATMLHTKSVVAKETYSWFRMLHSKRGSSASEIGIEYPDGKGLTDREVSVEVRGELYFANCFPIEKVEKYWIPKLKTLNKVND